MSLSRRTIGKASIVLAAIAAYHLTIGASTETLSYRDFSVVKSHIGRAQPHYKLEFYDNELGTNVYVANSSDSVTITTEIKGVGRVKYYGRRSGGIFGSIDAKLSHFKIRGINGRNGEFTVSPYEGVRNHYGEIVEWTNPNVWKSHELQYKRLLHSAHIISMSREKHQLAKDQTLASRLE